MSYWNSQPNSNKRNALEATLQLADWLAANGKYFFPNLGMGDGKQPTQAETNYGFAFFNLMRRGNLQFYSQVMKDSGGLLAAEGLPGNEFATGPAIRGAAADFAERLPQEFRARHCLRESLR